MSRSLRSELESAFRSMRPGGMVAVRNEVDRTLSLWCAGLGQEEPHRQDLLKEVATVNVALRINGYEIPQQLDLTAVITHGIASELQQLQELRGLQAQSNPRVWATGYVARFISGLKDNPHARRACRTMVAEVNSSYKVKQSTRFRQKSLDGKSHDSTMASLGASSELMGWAWNWDGSPESHAGSSSVVDPSDFGALVSSGQYSSHFPATMSPANNVSPPIMNSDNSGASPSLYGSDWPTSTQPQVGRSRTDTMEGSNTKRRTRVLKINTELDKVLGNVQAGAGHDVWSPSTSVLSAGTSGTSPFLQNAPAGSPSEAFGSPGPSSTPDMFGSPSSSAYSPTWSPGSQSLSDNEARLARMLFGN